MNSLQYNNINDPVYEAAGEVDDPDDPEEQQQDPTYILPDHPDEQKQLELQGCIKFLIPF